MTIEKRVLARNGNCSNCRETIKKLDEEVCIINSAKHRKPIILCVYCVAEIHMKFKKGEK